MKKKYSNFIVFYATIFCLLYVNLQILAEAKDELKEFHKLVAEFNASLNTTKNQLSLIQKRNIARQQHLEPAGIFTLETGDVDSSIITAQAVPTTIQESPTSYKTSVGTLYERGEFLVECGDPEVWISDGKHKLGTLGAFIEMGLDRYNPAQIALEKINLAKIKVRQAYRALFPSAAFKWEELEGTTTTGPYVGRNYGIELQQSVFNGGRLWSILEQSKLDLNIAIKNYVKVKDDLTFEVAKAYYNLAKAEKELENQKALMDEGNQILDIAKKSLKEKVISTADYINIESMYNQIYFQYISAQKDLNLARFLLMQALNISLDEEFQCPPVEFPKDPLKRFGVSLSKEVEGEYGLDVDVEYEELNLDGYLEYAFENRPEFGINELLVKFNELGKKIGESENKPKVDLIGSYGKGAEAFENDPLELGGEWFMGLQLSWPWGGNIVDYSYSQTKTAPVIGESQRTESTTNSFKFSFLNNLESLSKRKEAEINFAQSVYEFEEMKKIVNKEVKEAYLACQKAVLQLDAAENKVEYREKALEILKIRAGQAEITTADLLSGMISLVSEKTAYYNALLNYYVSVAGLDRAVGVWEIN